MSGDINNNNSIKDESKGRDCMVSEQAKLMSVLLGVQLKQLTNQELADLNFNIVDATNFLYASSAAYCVQKDLVTFTCPPCKNLTTYHLFNMTLSQTMEGEPQKVLFLVDTHSDKLVVAFEGTHNLDQIVHQSLNVHGMHYDLQDDLPEAIVDSYCLKTYHNGEFRNSV